MDKTVEDMILADAITTVIETERENVMLRRVVCMLAVAVVALAVILVAR